MSTNRRHFLRQSAALGIGFSIVPSFVRAGGPGVRPGDKLNLGFIGCGRQSIGLGNRFAAQEGAQLVATSDVYAAKMDVFIQEKNGIYAEQRGKSNYDGITRYDDWRALLDHPGLDGVVIATPDHWHATMCVAALNGGLHVYCEKPLAHTIKEGRAIVDAAKKNNKILQTGSMQRSRHNFRHAVELIRNGYLGEMQEAIVSVGPPPKTFDLTPEAAPIGLRWKEWVGPSQDRGFHPLLAPQPGERLWPKWRDYAEWGGGMVTDWGAHMFDIVQWALDMDESGPVRFRPSPVGTTELGGGFSYANGFKVTHQSFDRGNAIRFIGSEGQLDVSRGFLDSPIAGLVEREIKEGEERVYFSDGHEADFITSAKAGKDPICSAETGHRTASVCTAMNICYRLGEALDWNPEKEKFAGNGQANRLRGKAYRMKI